MSFISSLFAAFCSGFGFGFTVVGFVLQAIAFVIGLVMFVAVAAVIVAICAIGFAFVTDSIRIRQNVLRYANLTREDIIAEYRRLRERVANALAEMACRNISSDSALGREKEEVMTDLARIMAQMDLNDLKSASDVCIALDIRLDRLFKALNGDAGALLAIDVDDKGRRPPPPAPKGEGYCARLEE